MFTKQPIIVFIYKEALSSTNQFSDFLPPFAILHLQDFDDVFHNEIPKGLPSIQGIEHQSDFIVGSTIPNHQQRT